MAFQDRRNNPGNLKFANQPGALGADEKGFAVFPDKETGMSAMRRQIELDLVDRGKTGREFIHKYAPPSDNNPTDAYVQNVFGELGIDPDKKVDPAKIPEIQRLMVRQEHGREGMQHYYANGEKSPSGTTPSAASIVAGTAATGIAAKSLFNNDQQDQAELQRAAQMAAEREAGIGTLKQYTNRPAGEYMDLLNQSRNQRKRRMMAAIEQRRRNKKQVAEEVSFKDLRKKIQEQIIMNEENQK